MASITEITRRNIFDTINIENISWGGSLEETNFLSRIWDLTSMPSFDGRFENFAGDIWQHRVNNHDWEDDWIFDDSRLNLYKCDDDIFLQFLCEMVHPVVRRDKVEVAKMVQMFNEYLSFDGFELIEKAKISGHSIYAGRQKLITNAITNKKETLKVLTGEYIVRQITLMESAIETAPDLAIGTSKEFIETICKTILDELEIEDITDYDLPKLLKETSKQLKLTPHDIPNEAKAAESIRKILGSLSTVVQGIAELRNSYGTGHGKNSKFKGLSPRHAKLAVGAASTLGVFLFETHKTRLEITSLNKKTEEN